MNFIFHTGAPNHQRKFIITEYNVFLKKTSNVYLTVAKHLLFLLVGKNADLGKFRAPDLLLNATQKFVPYAEQPTRDLDNGVGNDK